MNWGIITEDWRLKLLALGLAILMLGALAFSENPPTSNTVSVQLAYPTPPAGMILVNPPTRINVTYSGSADAIKSITANNLTATVDTAHAHPGQGVRLNVTPGPPINGITFQTPPPIPVNVDKLATVDVPVSVPIPRSASGWSVTSATAICQGAAKPKPCHVSFTGPASWENNLQGTAPYPGPPVNFTGPSDVLTQPVQLANINGPLDLTQNRTIPTALVDPATVTIEITAVAGSNFSTVALVDAAPSHPPPSGYHITGVTVSPGTVIIQGDPATLGRIERITLPALDLSNRTSDATFQVAIDYASLNVTGNVPNATITFSISRNPTVTSPSPGP